MQAKTEPARILIVDDEHRIREVLRKYLVAEGFGVGEAADGEAALAEIRSGHWDLVILDIMLPKIDGWEVCREIRKISDVPILMLTARGDEIDRVLGLELGADDYIVKPFSPREVVARVKAVLRRARKSSTPGKQIVLGNVVIEPEARTVTVGGKTLALTPKEFDLLLTLARSPGKVFRREELLDLVWGYDFYGDSRTVDTHVARLREKLNQAGAPPLIATVWGVGYKLEVRNAEHSS
ncbi:two component transcriptional regulator, winged helix family [Ammonifex degensii KC4]|uniref:Stage 0 sporulation protein A homolog n=1 Tax=Ammonifex degensii (strain DSM 10501 / KC4) TaxID=429009 RepID=C9RD34_AMMDK|nr:response regulator transcription factor [Ammonifex degensii]ACX52161.1 two component transcriptional regulator, winged helix family [Ammonifex degensii KC4]